MRGEDGTDAGVLDEARDGVHPRALRGNAVECVRDAPALRARARERVCAAPPILMHVLGEVRQVREVAERTDDVERLRDREPVEQPRERGLRAAGIGGVRSPEPDRRLPDRLDPFECRIAGLRAQHVAQQASQETRVLAQRQVLVVQGVHRAVVSVPISVHRAAKIHRRRACNTRAID